MNALDKQSLLREIQNIAEQQFSEIKARVLEEKKKGKKGEGRGSLTRSEIRFVKDSAKELCEDEDLQDSFLGVSAKDILLLEGTRFFRRFSYEDYENGLLFVVEQEPQVRTLNFSSSFFYEEQTKYYREENNDKKYPRDGNRHHVQLAFPYVIFVVVISPDDDNYNFLVYYSNKPLRSLKDEVFEVNLPNCYESGNVCMRFDGFSADDTPAKKVAALITSFWGSEFNADFSSGYFNFRKVNKEFSTIWEWEKNSLKNPNFVLGVKWPLGNSLKKNIDDCLGDYLDCDEEIQERTLLHNLDSSFGYFSSGLLDRVRGFVDKVGSSIAPIVSFPKLLEENLAKHLLSGGNYVNVAIRKKKKIMKGARVRLRRDSEYYHEARDIKGTVKSDFGNFDNGDYWARVEFDNGYSNRYRRKDLRLL